MRGSSLHYEATGDYDLIDVIQDYNLNFNRGNIIKYICRAGKKENNPELADLYKALDYLEREITYIKELRTDKDKEWKD